MKLLEQVSERLRVMHYAFRTEQAYRQWVERYLKFLRQRDPQRRWVHPREVGAQGVQAFLSHLAPPEPRVPHIVARGGVCDF